MSTKLYSRTVRFLFQSLIKSALRDGLELGGGAVVTRAVLDTGV